MPYNYFNPYNTQYVPQGYNPYIQQQQRVQEQYQQYNRQQGLQGKIVTNIDEVKAIDIPLDGSTSYFALANGTAIVSKQLQQDGTSKMIVYVPQPEEKQEEIKYITQSDLKAQFGEFNPRDIKELKEEIKTLKRQIRSITDDIEEKRGE